MEKFTAGNWAIDDTYSTMQMVCAGSVSICDVECGYNHESSTINPSEQEKANAHLIAAAPDMYRLLENIANDIDVMCEADSERAGLILGALSKARGE